MCPLCEGPTDVVEIGRPGAGKLYHCDNCKVFHDPEDVKHEG